VKALRRRLHRQLLTQRRSRSASEAIHARFILGVLLILSGVAYVVACATAILFPARLEALNTVAFPLYFGELLVILWLAFVGAKPRAAGA
jgi:hypothetical protein